MGRVFVLVLDSLGVGALPDADAFGDAGAHTLDHIIEAAGGLDLPRLRALGLGNVEGVHRLPPVTLPEGAFGRMAEASVGKDTSTGHWELMGCPLDAAFPVFPSGFPQEFMERFTERAGLDGFLCNEAASGTEIIERLGPEHIASGLPIVYTSADSVFQIAAHEEHFGLERLLKICRIARELLDEYGVARVIARPFVGQPGAFRRTYHRRDFSLEAPHPTTLDRLVTAGIEVVGIGKIDDIFAGRGLTRVIHTEGNRDGMRRTMEVADDLAAGLVFVNLVDFDMLYGHRRDALGYRRALEEFDHDYSELEERLDPEDLVFLTADHGNDPTHSPGTDHTREYVPILAAGGRVCPGTALGTRSSFADLGATVEEALGLVTDGPGRSFLEQILRSSSRQVSEWSGEA